jgi:tetratricopeptide (TPR) repeat protein
LAYSRRAAAWANKHDRDQEASDLTMAIRLEPGNASYRIARAESYSAQGRHKLAMADYDDALRIEANSASIWVSRGNEWRRDLKLDEALADYTRAIQLDPRFAPAYVGRGNVWKQRRAFDKAIEEFSYLIRLEPQNALAHQTLARILATCHEASFRNGKRAVDEATQACELTHWQDPDCVDTLAASCAEVGDFTAAIKWQTQAIKLLGQNAPSLLQRSMNFGGRKGVQFDDRLTFYKSKKPVRE